MRTLRQRPARRSLRLDGTPFVLSNRRSRSPELGLRVTLRSPELPCVSLSGRVRVCGQRWRDDCGARRGAAGRGAGAERVSPFQADALTRRSSASLELALLHVVGTRSASRAAVARHHPMSTAPCGSPTRARVHTPGRPVSRPVLSRARRVRRSAIVSSTSYSGRTMKSKVTGALAAGIALAIRNDSRVAARVREDQRRREQQGHHRDLLGR